VQLSNLCGPTSYDEFSAADDASNFFNVFFNHMLQHNCISMILVKKIYFDAQNENILNLRHI